MESQVHHFIMVALLLAGCGLTPQNTDVMVDTGPLDTSGDTVQGSDSGDISDDTEVDMTALAVTAISPMYSTLSGGESVVISGGPFTEGAVVRFGDVEADVSLVTANEIIATAPAQEEADVVDVSVVIGDEGGTLPARRHVPGPQVAHSAATRSLRDLVPVSELEGGWPLGSHAVVVMDRLAMTRDEVEGPDSGLRRHAAGRSSEGPPEVPVQ